MWTGGQPSAGVLSRAGDLAGEAWGCLATPPDEDTTLHHQAGSRPKLLVRPTSEDFRFFRLGIAASGPGLRSADSSEEKYLEVVRLLLRLRPFIFISLTGVPPVVGFCDPAVGKNLGSDQTSRGVFSDKEGRVVEAVTRKNAQLVLLDNITP